MQYEMKIFNFINIPNNLVYFQYEIPFREEKDEKFINLNNLNSLEYLYLSNITYRKKFELKLKNLKSFKLINCCNISFMNCDFRKLKYLELNSYDKYNKYYENDLIEFPELNTLIFNHNNQYENYYDSDSDYKSIINLKSIKKLKIFRGDMDMFLKLENIEHLEKLILYSYGQTFLEKIILTNNLKEIEIFFQDDIYGINNLNIKEKNYSVTKLIIHLEELDELNITYSTFL